MGSEGQNENCFIVMVGLDPTTFGDLGRVEIVRFVVGVPLARVGRVKPDHDGCMERGGDGYLERHPKWHPERPPERPVDMKLLAWGRAAARRLGTTAPPVLWLFTDTARLPDPRPAAARLPRGISGVVLRHDSHPNRVAIGRDLARICRIRGLALVVAGDVRLAAALGAGVHLRGGRWPGPLRLGGIVTSSAHSLADLRRARRNGATIAFLSPAFATASHPGEPALGACRWAGLAGRAGLPVAALGGIGGDSVRLLPRARCHGVGAIGALV